MSLLYHSLVHKAGLAHQTKLHELSARLSLSSIDSMSGAALHQRNLRAPKLSRADLAQLARGLDHGNGTLAMHMLRKYMQALSYSFTKPLEAESSGR